MRNLLLVTTIVAIAPISQSLAAPCRVPGKPNSFKWETPLSLNEIFKSHPSGDPSTWKFTQQRLYYGRLYKDTPEDACKLFAKKFSPISGFTKAQRNLNEVIDLPPSTTEKMCVFDCFPTDGTHHGDGVLDDNDVSECGIAVNEQTGLQTDDICDRSADVHGPYDDGTTGYVRGADFTTAQKNAFKAANEARNPDPGRLKSDAYGVSVQTCTGAIDLHEDEYEFLKAMAGSASSVQVDHLVPRKDVFGCGCGTNSPANAGLVSQWLNNGMSNDPDNEARLALLCRFAPDPALCPPPPPAPCPLTGSNAVDAVDGDDLDDDDVDGDGVARDGGAVDHVEDVQPVKPEAAAAPAQGDEIGGCSAGGATGGASALALIGFVGFARRRGTRSRRR